MKIIVGLTILFLAFGFSTGYAASYAHPGLRDIVETPFQRFPLLTLSKAEYLKLFTTWDKEDLKDLIDQSISHGLNLKVMSRRDLIDYLSKSPEGIKKVNLARYGFMEASYDNGDAPMQFVRRTKKGKEIWSPNCFLCHAGNINGKPFIGQPNSEVDISSFVEDTMKLRVGKIAAAASLKVTPCYPFGRVKGANNAACIVAYNMMIRNKHLDRSLIINNVGRIYNFDEDVPPWWNIKRKKRMYWDGNSPIHKKSLMGLTLAPENSGDLIRSWDGKFVNILSYIRSLPAPPKYPGTVNASLSIKGEKLFIKTCAKCHGKYGASQRYPEKVIDHEKVGTDSARLKLTPSNKFLKVFKNSWIGDYGKLDLWVERKGFIAPALNGVWATGPYFHNGSVPTLYGVLFPEERPDIWKNHGVYDLVKIGKKFDEVKKIPKKLSNWKKRFYVNTAVLGKGNSGHDMGKELSKDQRLAILEYLKTL